VLDFSGPEHHPPVFSVPVGPFGGVCSAGAAPQVPAEIAGLAAMAQQYGFALH
jgi:hypothetical protein